MAREKLNLLRDHMTRLAKETGLGRMIQEGAVGSDFERSAHFTFEHGAVTVYLKAGSISPPSILSPEEQAIQETGAPLAKGLPPLPSSWAQSDPRATKPAPGVRRAPLTRRLEQASVEE